MLDPVGQAAGLAGADVDDAVDLLLHAGSDDHVGKLVHIDEVIEVFAAGEREGLFAVQFGLSQFGKDGTAVGLVASDVVGAQPVQLAGAAVQREHQALAQGVFGDAVLALGLAGGAFVDGTLPVAHFVHSAHDA